jgi:adenylate kinase
MDTLHNVMFFGPQGSGKGTQKKLLRDAFMQVSGKETVELELGQFFRDMVGESGHTNDLVRESLREGKLQPDFLSVYGAAGILVNSYTGNEHIIADGFPRKQLQAELFHQMVMFYDLGITVIVLELSEEESVKRLLLRGREDDTEEAIKKRLNWYHADVEPLLEFFEKYPDQYRVHAVNGEQSIEAVHSSVRSILGLK